MELLTYWNLTGMQRKYETEAVASVLPRLYATLEKGAGGRLRDWRSWKLWPARAELHFKMALNRANPADPVLQGECYLHLAEARRLTDDFVLARESLTAWWGISGAVEQRTSFSSPVRFGRPSTLFIGPSC